MIETRRGLALLVAVFALSSIASAQVNFRDDAGFNFYDNLNMESSANISMNGNRILGLPSAQSSGEPLTLGGGSGDFVERQGDSMEGDLDMKNNLILGDRATIDFNSGELTLNQDMPASGSPTTIQLNQDGNPNWALVSMQDGGLGIYDLQNNQFVQEFNENGPTEISNEKLRVTTGELALSGCNLSSSTNSLKLSSCNMNLANSDLTNVNFITGDGQAIQVANQLNTSSINTQGSNIELDGGYVSNDGSNEGLSIGDSGNVEITNGNLDMQGNVVSNIGGGNKKSLTFRQSGQIYVENSSGTIGPYKMEFEGDGVEIEDGMVFGQTPPSGNNLDLKGNDILNVGFLTSDSDRLDVGGGLKLNGDNVELEGGYISNDGQNEGVKIGSNGDVRMIAGRNYEDVEVAAEGRYGGSIFDVTASGSNQETDWNQVDALSVESANNDLTLFTSGIGNQRRSFIQAGHASGGFSDVFGELALNPFGGSMGIGTLSPDAKLDLEGGSFDLSGNDLLNVNFLTPQGSELSIGGNTEIQDNLTVQGDYDLQGNPSSDIETFRQNIHFREQERCKEYRLSPDRECGILRFDFARNDAGYIYGLESDPNEGTGTTGDDDGVFAITVGDNDGDDILIGGDPNMTSGTPGHIFIEGNGGIRMNGHDLTGAGTISGDTKNFVQEVNETHEVVYTSQESADARAVVEDSSSVEGSTLIEFPDHFSKVLSDSEPDVKVQLTPHKYISGSLGVPERNGTHMVVQGPVDEEIGFDYRVTGVRNGYEHKKVVRKR